MRRIILAIALVGVLTGCQLRGASPSPTVGTLAQVPASTALTAQQAFPASGTWAYKVVKADGTTSLTAYVERKATPNGYVETTRVLSNGQEVFGAPATYEYAPTGLTFQGSNPSITFPASLTAGAAFEATNGDRWQATSWIETTVAAGKFTCLLVQHAPTGATFDSPDSDQSCYAPGKGLVLQIYQNQGERLRKELQ